ncbi:MAG: hypothetical protein ACREIB_13235 [Pseudomonadota bacterium]
MPPKEDQNDGGTGDGQNGEVKGLKAALEAERRQRQAAEARTSGLETSVAELRGRLDGMATNGTRPAQKPLTRAELKQAVAEDKITEDESDAIWERQITEKAVKEAVSAAKETVETGTLSGRISAEIGRYKAVVEGLDYKESAAFQKVAAEFRHLTGLGYNADEIRTEVAALRAAFGPIEALETTTKPREREGHRETGGRSGSERDGDRHDGYPRGFPDRMRAHYDRMIDRGQYSGKDDPRFKKEMERWKARQGRSERQGRAA